MSKASIFIVEDEHIVAMDIRDNLELCGYQVVGHTDRGEMAIKKAAELLPDLILMDIRLRGKMDGIEAAEYIRAHFDIPVIFLTAHSDPATLQRAQVTEPFGYILKPFERRELDSNISIALYKHGVDKKLHESENKFRSVIEHASDGIALIDNEGNLIEWNRIMEQITDLKRSEVIGRPIWDIVFQTLPGEKKNAETQEAMITQWKVEIQNGYVNINHITEYEIEGPQRARRTVQSNGFIIDTIQGRLGGVIMRDVTEQKRSEIELRKLSQAVEQSASSIIVTDIEGIIEFANPKFVEVSGYSLSDTLGKNPGILNSGKHNDEFYQHFWQTIKAGKIWRGQFHNKRKDGTLYWEEASIAPVYDITGKMINFISVNQDITARKLLEETERDQRQLAEALQDTAMILNSTLKLDDVLDRILANIGKLVPYDMAMVSLIEGDEIRKIRYHNNSQSTVNKLQIGDMHANLLNVPILKTIIKTRQPHLIPDIQKDTRWQVVAIPGMQRIHSLICAPIEIHEIVLGVINIVSAFPDFFSQLHTDRIMAFANQAAVAIENAQLYEQAKQLSVIDPLTGLFNMRYFLDFGRLEFERVQRYARTLSVVMIDIDHFKVINDTYSHGTGDIVLREITTRIKSSVRTVDVVARYGGEEFVILMPETGLEDARQVTERVRQIIANSPIETKDGAITTTFSAGIAEKDNSTKNLDDLLQLADQAMYKAKANGRNCVEFYSIGK